MLDELPIIQRILEGDVEAYRHLVDRYQTPLLRFIGNIIHNPNDHDDIAQDAFLKAYVNLSAYNPRMGRFSTWIMRIARNCCFDYLKQRRVQSLEFVPEKIDARTPEDSVAADEFNRQLDEALAGLPVEQKIAFVLAEIEGMSHEEIGRIEDVPLGTVKSRISRAKEKLRAVLMHEEPCP